MSSRERLTVSLPADMVERLRATAGSREVSAYVERALRHEMLAAPYSVAADPELQDDLETLHDEARRRR